jgi:hypothetical protein
MQIIDYYYNEDEQILEIRFTTNPHSDFYRLSKLSIDDIFYYTPTIIEEEDLLDIDNDFVMELLNEYFNSNDLPPEQLL